MATELERTRAQLRDMQMASFKQEVAEVEAKAVLRAAQAQADQKRQAQERAAAQAEDIESSRRYSWFAHRCKVAADAGNPEGLEFRTIMDSIPADGWPPGQSASDLFPNLAPSRVEPADDLGELPMIKRARELGVKI